MQTLHCTVSRYTMPSCLSQIIVIDLRVAVLCKVDEKVNFVPAFWSFAKEDSPSKEDFTRDLPHSRNACSNQPVRLHNSVQSSFQILQHIQHMLPTVQYSCHKNKQKLLHNWQRWSSRNHMQYFY
jgi:hypothetical protein